MIDNSKVVSSENTELTYQYLVNNPENKYFDRKSAQIKLADLAPIVLSLIHI